MKLSLWPAPPPDPFSSPVLLERYLSTCCGQALDGRSRAVPCTTMLHGATLLHHSFLQVIFPLQKDVGFLLGTDFDRPYQLPSCPARSRNRPFLFLPLISTTDSQHACFRRPGFPFFGRPLPTSQNISKPTARHGTWPRRGNDRGRRLFSLGRVWATEFVVTAFGTAIRHDKRTPMPPFLLLLPSPRLPFK